MMPARRLPASAGRVAARRCALLAIALACAGLAVRAFGAEVAPDPAWPRQMPAKAAFLLDFNDPAKAAGYFRLIVGSYDRLKARGLEPSMALVLIGPTVNFVRREPDPELEHQFEDDLASMAASVAAFRARGVRIELCALSAQGHGLSLDGFLPGITVVEDGFVTLIGWQQQGYALVPVF